MKNSKRLYNLPFLISIVCLGLITLMSFQIVWLQTSKDLIEEQFDQKVNLAMGSALADYNRHHHTELDIETEECDSESFSYIPLKQGEMSLSNQEELKESLSLYMGCFGIDEKYSVSFFDQTCEVGTANYCCSINTKVGCSTDYKLGVSFQARDEYLFDKMKFMVISSILIFFFLSAISLLILSALIKQKRITENNIDFFNNTAHELKTPLTNISLAVNLLKKKTPELSESRYANIIKAESEKLSGQVERVLFLSRMESGEHELKVQPVNLNELLHEVVNNMQMLVDAKNGSINLSLPTNSVIIQGDYYHLCNVFRNLIDNAIKYCDKKPELTISLKETGDHVKLSFLDNGIGICPKDQEHIFEKFQRVNKGNLHESKGFGIGLSYVKTVVELHKGLINVVSVLNKGSQFELILPQQMKVSSASIK